MSDRRTNTRALGWAAAGAGLALADLLLVLTILVPRWATQAPWQTVTALAVVAALGCIACACEIRAHFILRDGPGLEDR